MDDQIKFSDGCSKAERRHQMKRIKDKRSKYILAQFIQSKRALGRLCSTPAPCSCFMCGNPRKYAKGKERLTVQELRADDSVTVGQIINQWLRL